MAAVRYRNCRKREDEHPRGIPSQAASGDIFLPEIRHPRPSSAAWVGDSRGYIPDEAAGQSELCAASNAKRFSDVGCKGFSATIRENQEGARLKSRRISTIEVAGDTLFYKVTGEGTPLLLIAGGGGDGDLYLPLADALADSFMIITYDRRENARSSMNHPDQFSVFQQAEDAVAILDAVGVQDAYVFGNSSGAVLAVASSRLTAAVSIAARILRAVSTSVMVISPIPAGF